MGLNLANRLLLRNRNKIKLQPSARVVDFGHKSCFSSLERGERKQSSRKIYDSTKIDSTKIDFSQLSNKRVKICNTIIRKVNSVGDSKSDSLLIIKGEAIYEGCEDWCLPIKAQLDAGSEVTIMERSYAEGLSLRIEDRDPKDFQGVNGVRNGATQWITQDAIVKVRFTARKILSFSDKGKPIDGDDDQYLEILFRFGIVDTIGTPCIIGADSLRSLDANHYYNPDKLVIQGSHSIECMSLEEAQDDARERADSYWADIIKEDIRQSSRVKTIKNLEKRVRILPGKAAVVCVQGSTGLISREDVSLVEVINNPTRRERFKYLKIRGGFCSGQPIVTLMNSGLNPIVVYRTDIQVRVSPRKLGFHMLKDEMEEILAIDKKLEAEVIRSNSTVLVKNEFPIVKVVPKSL